MIVIFTYHLLVRFPTKDRVRKIREDQILAKQYFLIATKMKKLVEALSIKISEQKDKTEVSKNWGEPIEQFITILLGKDLEKTI